MRLMLASAALLLSANMSSAQSMSISGTVRDLKGVPLENLLDFTVQAFSGGAKIADGTVTSVAPFVYTIKINATDVNPNDVRVLLSFRATGRLPVDFDKVVGKASKNVGGAITGVNGNQTVDVVMPEVEPHPLIVENCCPPRKHHFFRR